MAIRAMEHGIMPYLLTDASPLSAEDKAMLMEMYEAEGNKAWERVAGDDPLDERRLSRTSYTYYELLDQPKQIRETIGSEREAIREAAKQVAQKKVERIYMVGCGDSVASLRGSKYVMEKLLKVPVEVYDALEFCFKHEILTENDLVMCLSSSGRTIRVVEALLVARSKGAQTLALTNTAGSALWNYASSKMLIHASRKGWPTQSSTSAMAMVQQFALDLAAELGTCPEHDALQAAFDSIPDEMTKVIKNVEPKIKELAKKLVDEKMVVFTGGGPFFTCAEFGCAKVKESTPNYSLALELEEFHHFNSVKAGDTLFLFAPKGISEYRAVETVYSAKSVGASVVSITNTGADEVIKESDDAIVIDSINEYFDNYLFAIPVQMFGYYLSVEMVEKAGGKIVPQ